MIFFLSLLTLIGYNAFFWLIMGIIRIIYEKREEPKERIKRRLTPTPFTLVDIAALIPAHNEEKSIRRTINALLKVLPRKNIYVASDRSTDSTVKIARELGVRCLAIRRNMGKAKALVHTMRTYGLLKKYKAVLINDADSTIDPRYLPQALQAFRDEGVAAVTPHGVTMAKRYSFREMFYISYRIRLWRVIQYLMRYGQTWKFANVSFIIPGSYSIYRTRVLKKLKIDAPGLVIEDFNMTFEVHKKRLGRIAYLPNVYGIHQDPYTLFDYIKQVKRWNIGFFQTVKRNGVWPSLFWIATGSFLLEMTLFALFLVLSPLLILQFVVNGFEPITIPYLYARLGFFDLMIGIFLMDYVQTIFVAIFEKKPSLLFYGFGFIFLRYIDGLIYLYSIPKAFLTSSSGVWKSPKRQ